MRIADETRMMRKTKGDGGVATGSFQDAVRHNIAWTCLGGPPASPPEVATVVFFCCLSLSAASPAADWTANEEEHSMQMCAKVTFLPQSQILKSDHKRQCFTLHQEIWMAFFFQLKQLAEVTRHSVMARIFKRRPRYAKVKPSSPNFEENEEENEENEDILTFAFGSSASLRLLPGVFSVLA